MGLTPKEKHLYMACKGAIKVARSLSQENSSFKDVIRNAKNSLLNDLSEKVNETTVNFISSQIKLQKLPVKGRRYSLEDKILAMALQRQSGKGYKLMERIFALPSKKAINSLLSNVPFGPGLCDQLLASIGRCVAKLHPLDRVCILIFDEMAIQPALYYNKSSDEIEGFDDAGEKTNEFAHHVMVFMARGIRRKWKQPICFYFTKTGVKTPEIKKK